ncbi:MAG TPA: MFS transporter [Candidatus Acidoferrum sp.]|nr:MFS transporter [Candidatus Acidoferrum sp.]
MSRDLFIINTTAFLRSFTFGLTGVVLGIYLFRVGLSSSSIGVVVAAGLLGSALATIGVTTKADSAGRRRTLVVLSLLGAIGALALAFTPALPVLLVMAFVGMLNGTGTDRSAAFTLEQAIIPGLVPDVSRTWGLAWYNVVLDTAGSLGALAAALPLLLQRWLGLPLLASYRTVFFGCAFLGVVGAILYPFGSAAVELSKSATEATPHHVSPASKKVVTKLASLFSLDAFGGGFLTDALVAYWFFRRFGVAEQSLGLLFFAVHLLNAVSHLGAAWLARRIGLVKTMVFTHLPSSLFLVAAAFAPSLKVAIVLFLCREALVEMDVPTRQSYVAAVVLPSERTFASGIANLSRNIFWAVGSSIAGFLMQNVAFSAPLVIGGGAKISYDLLLYRAFRNLRPPEEH